MNEPIPFKTDVNDFDYAEGLMSFRDGHLFLQLEVKDEFTDTPKSELLEVLVAADQMGKVTLKSNLLRVKITILFSNLKVSHQIPGHRSGTLHFRISKKYSTQAKTLAADLQLGISEAQLRKAQQTKMKGLD